MGSIIATFKRFLGNKNTVTILAVLVGVIALWFFYNYRVEQAITTIKIPYAINRIDTGKMVNEEDIDYKEITKSTLDNSDIITNSNDLVGKYICVGTSVPVNGFFYQSQLCDTLPNSVLDTIPDDYFPWAMEVNSMVTFGNSILENSYIDIYLYAQDDNGQELFGPLIEGIQVLEVRDASNKNVFWDSTAGEPALLLFAVDEEMYDLLTTAQRVGITLRPMIRNASYSETPKEPTIGSDYLYNFVIRNKAEVIY